MFQYEALPLAAMLVFVCQLTQLRAVLSMTSWVSSGKDLAAAMDDQEVGTIFLLRSMVLHDNDWQGYNTPMLLTRNITVTSNASADMSETWPVLDFAFVSTKIRLADALSIEFRRVVLKDPRYFSQSMAPGIDLLAPCLPGSKAFLLLINVLIIYRVCYPATLSSKALDSAVRPSSFPGRQNFTAPLPQDGCLEDPGGQLPLMQRCWSYRGRGVDVAMYGAEWVAGSMVPSGYSICLKDMEYFCPAVIPEDCISRLGPVGCWNAWASGKLPPTGPPQHMDWAEAPSVAPGGGVENGHDGSLSGNDLAVILGCVLGGVALAAVLVVMVTVIRKKSKCSRKDGVLSKSKGSEAYDNASLAHSNSTGMAAVAAPAMDTQTRTAPAEVAIVLEESTKSARATADAKGDAVGSPRKGGLDFRTQNQRHPSKHGSAPSSVYQLGDKRQSNACAVVSPLTPPRQGLRLDVQMDNEVRLLPRVLGKGGFGKVVEGEYQGQRVAVKVLMEGTLETWGMAAGAAGVKAAPAAKGANPLKGEGGANEHGGEITGMSQEMLLRCLAQEVEVLGRCQHPNVVRLLAACLTLPRVCLVMELMDTSLDRLLYGREGELLPMDTVVGIALDVAQGLEYLHPTIVHRDLKPANVLIKTTTERPHFTAKITDFGLSRLRSTVVPTNTPQAGTPSYMAPELFDLENDQVTHKVDIFSFGVVLWTMLTGKRPWQGETMVMLVFRVWSRGERLPLQAIPEDRRLNKLIQLMLMCWEQDPQRRPAAAELVKWLLVLREQMSVNVRPALSEVPLTLPVVEEITSSTLLASSGTS